MAYIITYPFVEEFLYKDLDAESIWFHCDLPSLGKLPDLSPFKNLKHIDLTGNNISSLLGLDRLASIKDLERINLSSNKITSLEGLDALDSCKNLVRLGLSRNGLDISNLSPFSGIKSLETLGLSYNKITSFKSSIELPNLSYLNLSYNLIEEVSLENLPKLEKLFLNNNNLDHLDFSELNNLHSLNKVYVDNNKIKEIKGSADLPNLEGINHFVLSDYTKEEFITLMKTIHNSKLSTNIDFTIFEKFIGKKTFPEYELSLTEEQYRHLEYESGDFYIMGPSPEAIFYLNDFINVRLINGRTEIFVGFAPFQQCAFLLANIPAEDIENLPEFHTIDEISEFLDTSLEKASRFDFITPEEGFWAHCSVRHEAV